MSLAWDMYLSDRAQYNAELERYQRSLKPERKPARTPLETYEQCCEWMGKLNIPPLDFERWQQLSEGISLNYGQLKERR